MNYRPDQQPQAKKATFLARISQQYSGALTPIALSALSAWLIVTGIKGLAGFTVNRKTALADLLGIVIVVAVCRWMKLRSDQK